MALFEKGSCLRLPFQEPLYEALLLIWPNAKPLSAQARRFLEFCRRFYQPEAR